MTTHKLWMVLGAATLLLAACGRDRDNPPQTPAREVTMAPTTTPSKDGSVPSAAVVLAGQPNGPKDAASGARVPGALTDAQESTAMPLPGQNNDHSAPLPPARAASAR